MQCEICGKREASVHFKQVSDGVSKELFVCEDCAAENGFDVQSPISLTDFLFGVGGPGAAMGPAPVLAGEEKVCGVCGLTTGEFRKNSRLGCGTCYEAFEGELAPLLKSMHRGTRHMGKVPAGEKVAAEIAALQEALERAVGSQAFEEAARLRDRIREVRQASGKREEGGAGHGD